ncbi:MAG: XRE family transcriptional regulator, partial [Deltaproteobacteria bacterium]|nr:XRE family transcriptional regulator [Deltaproteobacteria bacterium]
GRQKAFQLGREIGYRQLRLKARGATSSRAEVESFEQVLNDFKASYYSGALLIDQAMLVEDMKAFFSLPTWDAQALLRIMNRYQVTPEMFLYRLTQLLPTHFGLEGLQFFRVNHTPEKNSFHINKQLNMTAQVRTPGMGSGEHHCRRWIAVDLLKTLAGQAHPDPAAPPLVSAQRIRFLEDGSEFFLMTLARSLALTPGANTSVTLALAFNDPFRSAVRFHGDAQVPFAQVSDSCERCPLPADHCEQRVAPPRIHLARQAHEERRVALEKVLEQGLGE